MKTRLANLRLAGVRLSPIDEHIANRINERRLELGMSFVAIGLALKLPKNKVDMFETGRARYSASQLFELSKILDVPVGHFFDGL